MEREDLERLFESAGPRHQPPARINLLRGCGNLEVFHHEAEKLRSLGIPVLAKIVMIGGGTVKRETEWYASVPCARIIQCLPDLDWSGDEQRETQAVLRLICEVYPKDRRGLIRTAYTVWVLSVERAQALRINVRINTVRIAAHEFREWVIGTGESLLEEDRRAETSATASDDRGNDSADGCSA